MPPVDVSIARALYVVARVPRKPRRNRGQNFIYSVVLITTELHRRDVKCSTTVDG